MITTILITISVIAAVAFLLHHAIFCRTTSADS